MESNKHEVFIELGDRITAFISGIPDECNHDWNGPAYYITASGKFIDYRTHKNWIGYTDEYRQKVAHWYYTKVEEDHIIEGGITCSKCNKPFRPSFL